MAWCALIVAGFMETFGVAMMNEYRIRRNWQSIVLLLMGFGVSLILLSYSMRFISMGTAYAIWTGIGVVGGTLVGMIFYGESKEWKRLFFIAMVLCAAIGLKLIS